MEVIIILIVIVVLIKVFKPKREYKEIPQPILWVNGTYAVLGKINMWNPKIFGGFGDVASKIECKPALKNSWGVKNKQDLDETIQELVEGMHNNSLVSKVYDSEINTLSREEFEEEMKKLDKKEVVTYFTNMYNIYEKFGDNAILGWDLSRATSLCSMGCKAGFYTYQEGLTKALEISRQIQSTFNSWDEFHESYMAGYLFWSKDSVTSRGSGYNQRLKIIAGFKKDPKSFCHLDWNLDLNMVVDKDLNDKKERKQYNLKY